MKKRSEKKDILLADWKNDLGKWKDNLGEWKADLGDWKADLGDWNAEGTEKENNTINEEEAS